MNEDDIKEIETKDESDETAKRAGNVNIRVGKKRGLNKGLIIIAIIFVVIAIVIIGFALINKLNDKVYSNVYLNGINMSAKTEDEVKVEISKLSKDFLNRQIAVMDEDNELLEVTSNSVAMSVDEEKTVASIMDFGRSKNIVSNNFDIFKAMFSKENIEVTYTYSEDKLTEVANQISAAIEGRVIDDSYTLNEKDNVLAITKGVQGKDIVVTDFKANLINALKDAKITTLNIQLEIRKPAPLDVDVVYAKVVRDAKDAYIDDTVKPVKYTAHVVGISFAKEELKKALKENENLGEGKSFNFKLAVTEPKVKLADILKNAYGDALGSKTSSYVNSDSNRASNVALGAKILNGTIVMPGETFSFNSTMGDCGLSSRGFKPAAVFKGTKVAQEVGGGICQLSSTLYNAALYANLEIVSRSNHSLPVGYVPIGLDATIYYPYLDFKFKNNREYPIKIVATTTSSRKLTVMIYGTKQETEYNVELSSWVTATIASKVIKQNNSSLEKGKEKTVQTGTAGYKTVAYKTLKLNGKVISKTLLSQDTYGSTPRIIAVGTKVIGANPITPTEPETPTIAEEPTISTEPTTPTVATP